MINYNKLYSGLLILFRVGEKKMEKWKESIWVCLFNFVY